MPRPGRLRSCKRYPQRFLSAARQREQAYDQGPTEDAPAARLFSLRPLCKTLDAGVKQGIDGDVKEKVCNTLAEGRGQSGEGRENAPASLPSPSLRLARPRTTNVPL